MNYSPCKFCHIIITHSEKHGARKGSVPVMPKHTLYHSSLVFISIQLRSSLLTLIAICWAPEGPQPFCFTSLVQAPLQTFLCPMIKCDQENDCSGKGLEIGHKSYDSRIAQWIKQQARERDELMTLVNCWPMGGKVTPEPFKLPIIKRATPSISISSWLYKQTHHPVNYLYTWKFWF